MNRKTLPTSLAFLFFGSVYAIAGVDQRNNEIVMKVVNGESSPFRTTISLNGAGNFNPNGEMMTLSSAAETDDNSFDQPQKISPQKEAYKGFGKSFDMEFKPLFAYRPPLQKRVRFLTYMHL